MAKRRMRVTFAVTGESVVADLLDDEAPRTAQLVWEMLPLELKPQHGMFSGQEIFVLTPEARPMPQENLVTLPLPGEILYFYDGGGSVTTGRRQIGEICLVYGRGVTLRGPEGQNTVCSLFARIPGDWKTDWVAFADACRRVRLVGPQPLRFERVEG